MALDNFNGIVRLGSPYNSLKLLLVAAYHSRPPLRPLCRVLLKPFTQDGQVLVNYKCHGRAMRSYVRLSDLSSDFLSLMELGAGDTYGLDEGLEPELVIDGGGNIGLFTLRTTAMLAKNGSPARTVIFEPLPRNVEQIRRHLALNAVSAEIKAGCLGGTKRSIPFYCREAINSSFDPDEPYRAVLDIPVYTLEDAIGDESVERILIKLDIEGMEIEVLERFVPGEGRAVYVVGELHRFAVNEPILKRIFDDSGWTFEYFSIANDHANFRACSPAALPLLQTMQEVKARQPAGDLQKMNAAQAARQREQANCPGPELSRWKVAARAGRLLLFREAASAVWKRAASNEGWGERPT